MTGNFRLPDFAMTSSRRFAVLFAIFCSCMIAGCSKGDRSLVPVSGKVLIDGQPLTRGFVRFVPAKGRVSSGEIQSDGTFKLTCFKEGDGAHVGPNRIEVGSTEILSPTKIKWYAPKMYGSIATSGLTMNVEEETAEAVIELKWGNVKGPFVEQDKSGGT
jgi:hypothetical protein